MRDAAAYPVAAALSRASSSVMAKLFSRRQRWGPTWHGWIVLALLSMATMVAVARSIHSFLAVDRPVYADVLVVEGWIPEYAIRAYLSEDISASYARVITVGGPVTGASFPVKQDDTYAYVAAEAIRRLAFAPRQICIVPSTRIRRDRTFQCASDLRSWLDERHLVPDRIDILTLGPHARRTRLLFEKALGTGVKVGVIAGRNNEYDPDQWWRYSEGVKEVITESAAYLYARFLF